MGIFCSKSKKASKSNPSDNEVKKDALLPLPRPENQSSIKPPVSSNIKSKIISCIGCYRDLSKDKKKLACDSDHFVGVECGCSLTFFNTIFQDPEGKFPIKCPECSKLFSPEVIENVLENSPLL